MRKVFRNISLSLRFAVAVLVITGSVSIPVNIYARQAIVEDSFKIELPQLWSHSEKISPGFKVGFRKPMPNEDATFYFHHEVIPPGTDESLYNAADMRKQFDAIIRRQFPDAVFANSSSPRLNGKIIINVAYILTDNGKRMKQRYTYFISDRMAFVVRCSAAVENWETALPDFNQMIGSLAPGKAPRADSVSDEAAIGNLKQQLPTLLLSWPALWNAELGPVEISNRADSSLRSLNVTLIFVRRDIVSIYEYTKIIFKQIKQGTPEEKIDAEFKDAIGDSLQLIQYIGQIWGAAWSIVWKCDPPVDQFRINIADFDRKQVGAVSINREDGQAIISGKIAVSETKRVAAMYHFE